MESSKMNNLLRTLGAAAVVSTAATPALADVSCEDSAALTGSFGYVACQGVVTGNIAPGKTSVATFDGYGSFVLTGSTDSMDAGPFADDGFKTSGTLNFDQLITGAFVLGIKGGPTYSLYLFDGGAAGIASLNYDTLGVAKGNGLAGPGLSHASLFLPAGLPVTAVPEASSWAMMLAGLGMLGFVARRRA